MRIPKLGRTAGGVTAAALTLATVAAGGPISAATAGPAAARPLSAVSGDDAALVAALDGVLTDSRLNGTTTSMQVRDGSTGAVVYSRNGDQRIIPASNQKLMTSAAALEVLGGNYRFHTRVAYTGTKSGKTVKGSVYLQGRGDPTLTYGEFDKLATAVAKAGVTRFTGSLAADDTWFDRVPFGLDWSWQDETYASSAPISALTVASTADFDTGSLAVRSTGAAAVGQPAKLTITPPNKYVTIVNRTTTGAAKSVDTVAVARPHGTNTIVVTGSSPLHGAVGLDLVSVQNPTLLAAAVFRDALKRHGVTVVGATTTAATPASARLVIDRPSITLTQLLVPFLKLSNNGHAELLTKAMGRAQSPNAPGGWPTGLAAARTALAGLGVNTGTVLLGDGSGVSRRDMLTTRQLTNLLQAAQSRPWFSTWYAALPIAGDPVRLSGGTLTGRMRGTPAALNLHGKTGTLGGVNALSGYVKDTAGRRLVFSVVVNNGMDITIRDVLDAAAVQLAASGTGAGAAAARRNAAVKPPTGPRPVTRDGQEVECSWVLAC